ncbi:MAG: TonB-dependent receptor [Thalassotalea sp.]
MSINKKPARKQFIKNKLTLAVATALIPVALATSQLANAAEETTTSAEAAAIAKVKAAAKAKAEAAVEVKKPDETDVMEVIEVEGFRSSATRQLNNKRFADGISDSIFAEDMGKMPDANIAEAMSRITGIGIDRVDGEGTEITVRGVEGSYNNVTMNGVTMTNSGDDNSVDFSSMSADMLRSIEVIKSPSAKDDEGSLGATIRLNTWKPLDLKKPRTTINIKGVYNDLSEDFSPSIGLAFGRNFTDSFGMTASVNYSKTKTRSDRTTNSKWQFRQSVLAVDTDGNPLGANYWIKDMPEDFDGNGIPDQPYVPGEGRTITFDPYAYERNLSFNETENLSLSSSLQYIINDNSSIILNLTHSDKDKFTTQYNLNMQQVFTAEGPEAARTYPTGVLGEDGSLLQLWGPLPNARQVVWEKPIVTASDNIGLDYQQLLFDGTWTLDAKIGYSHSTQSWPIERSRKVIFNSNFGTSPAQPATADWRDGNGGLLISPQFGTASGEYYPSEYMPVQNAQFIVKERDDVSITYSLDLEGDIDFGPIVGMSIGAKVISREAKGEALTFNLDRGSELYPDSTRNEAGQLLSDISVADYSKEFTANNYLTDIIGGTANGWDLPDIDAIYNDYFPDPLVATSSSNPLLTFAEAYDADEPTNTQFASQAFYLMFNYEFLDGDLRGNFGYRYSETQSEARSRSGFRFRGYNPEGREIVDEFGYGTGEYEGAFNGSNFDITTVVTGEVDYGIGLPSFNARYSISPDMLLRFSFGKSMSRPRPSRLIPAYLITARAEGNTPTANGGNPDLGATEVNSYDLSWEWYFKKTAMVSIAPYFKDFVSMTYTRTDDRGFPLSECALAEEFPTNIRTEEEIAAALESGVILLDGINQQPYRDLHCGRITEGVETRTFFNGDGGKIFGIETAYQQDLDFLPGFLQHTGIILNYTYTDSAATYVDKNGTQQEQDEAKLLDGFPMRNTSKDTVNATVYWENEGFSARFAYNYRSKRLKNASNWDGALWEDDRETVDFSSRYKMDKNLSFTLAVTNLTKSYNRTFITRLKERPGLPSEGSALDGAPDWRTYTADYNGRNVRMGMTYRF